MGEDQELERAWGRHLGNLGVSEAGASAYLDLVQSGTRVPDEHLDELTSAHLVTGNGREPLPIRTATSAWVTRQQVQLHDVEARARELARWAAAAGLGGATSADFIDVISGHQKVSEIFGATHRSAQREVRAFDRPPYLSGPDTVQVEPTQPDVMARGVVYRAIYPTSLAQDQFTYDIIAASVELGEQARLAASLPLRMLLIDDTHGLVVLPRRVVKDGALHAGPDVDALIVHRSTLLDALQELFETTWANALPFVSEEGTAAWSVDPVDRRILSLMNTGLTDQRIAQVVGISERTVARRINRLQEQLSVAGRFALGVRAATDGLL